VPYDCGTYSQNYIAMCIPFLPESTLMFVLPTLIDLRLYTLNETWYEILTANLIYGFNNTFDFFSYYYIKIFNWLSFIV